MGLEVQLETSSDRGHFEVLVDGRTVVSRKGGLLALVLRKPWPDSADVVQAVREATSSAGS